MPSRFGTSNIASQFAGSIFDEASTFSVRAMDELTARVRTHQHQQVQSGHERRLLEDLTHALNGRYGHENPNSQTVPVPRSLLRALGDALHEATTRTISIQIAEMPSFAPLTQAAPPPPPPGISADHLELLRKIVDAGVEWDMIGADEGKALLESVGARPAKPPLGGMALGTGPRTGPAAFQRAYPPDGWPGMRGPMNWQSIDDSMIDEFMRATGPELRNLTATEVQRRNESARAQMDALSAQVQARLDADIVTTLQQAASLICNERGSVDIETGVVRVPVPLYRPPVPDRPAIPYPQSRSRFRRQGGR